MWKNTLYKIVFKPSAEQDLSFLDGSVRLDVYKKLDKIVKNPYSGKPLGNKQGVNLTGFYKMYAYKKKIRIVYAIYEDQIVVEVIGIGKRENSKIYRDLGKRI